MSQDSKMGSIYRQIARGKGLDVRTRAIFQQNAYNEVERNLKLAPYVVAQSTNLSSALKAFGVRVPRNLAWILLHSETPKLDLSTMLSQVKRCELNDQQKAIVVMRLLKSIHDTWVTQHANDFFSDDMAKYRCRFMPFELVGFSEIMKYRVYAEPVVRDLMDWDFDESILLSLYRKMQEACQRTLKIRTPEDLAEYLVAGRCRLLTKEIVNFMKNNPSVVRQVVMT